ncbi:Alanine racemase [Fundidesulfovibrio magnetotacticus]|uniref:Alanine racemase n=1 Tax=Fundidesulfovibrio magnetotacticus TaxID=2730080 RepID=A0A6V8LS32_9BACT|nr:alanine racemase [Fundidesulfovibrio magnetotacticus]GFK93371.1 Alanine racemase [Fundidesulfovibrio magnetotacticus]
MAIPWNKVTAVIDLADIVHNYKLLNARSGNAVPVVKADAYGHGLAQVAQVLAQEGAETFAVGTVEEAQALRASGHARNVLALLGPVDQADVRLAREARIVPFLHCFEQLDLLAAQPGAPLEVALKFDTGMRRLGFTLEDVPALAQRLEALPGVKAAYVCSHLATADEPAAHDYAREQGREFAAVREALAARGIRPRASIANSAGILAHPELHLDFQRAGVALYGTNPFQGTPLAHLGEGLRTAMQVRTKILSVHALKAGQTISYGRTYTAERDMTVAIAAAGYADAYSRGLSGRAGMCVNGRRAPVLGRVCMQMTAVDVSGIEGVAPGGDAWLLGGEGKGRVSAEELAGWWGSITYEVFCMLGLNRREYA